MLSKIYFCICDSQKLFCFSLSWEFFGGTSCWTMSFLKKFLKNEPKPVEVKNGPPAGVQTMGANLQRKFAKGVQYNSKYYFRLLSLYIFLEFVQILMCSIAIYCKKKFIFIKDLNIHWYIVTKWV